MFKPGRKSIMTQIFVPSRNGRPSIVKVQANKNYGICDLTLGVLIPIKGGKKEFAPIRRLDEILTFFQGRQYNDSYVMEHLKNVLTEILNSHE